MPPPNLPLGVPEGPREPGVINGPHESVDFLFERYLDAVYSYVLYRVPNRIEAEDITAETFAAALVAWTRYRGDSRPYAWLLGIARQKIAEAARRHDLVKRHEPLQSDLTPHEREAIALLLTVDIQQLPEDAALKKEAGRVMRHLLERLPEPQREALLLQVEHGLSIREIAQVMGRSEAAANSLLQRARAAIFRLGQVYFNQ
jgi:RNA polymerase sigma-70 factor (ECF subfamily)